MKDADYTVQSSKSFDGAVESVVAETKKRHFRVLHIHDVQDTLKRKNFQIEPLKIIEICNAQHARTVLEQDIRYGLCLPCKINVYKRVFPTTDLDTLLNKLDTVLENIIDKAAK